jgi:hypothetical protein
MKPYLLTIASDTQGMNRYLDSLSCLNNNYEHIAVQFEPFNKRIKSYKEHNFKYPGHLQRFKYVPKDLDPERYVIFTDTDDVIFQKPLPEVLNYDIYLASENVVHSQTIWNKYIQDYPVFSPLLHKEVYNCGMYIVKVPILYKYIEFMEWFQSGDFRKHNFEQMYFNMFLVLNPNLSKVIDSSILSSMYCNFDYGYIYKDGNLWKTKKGDIISCIHANGKNKEIL